MNLLPYRAALVALLLFPGCASHAGQGVAAQFHVLAPTGDLQRDATELTSKLLPQIAAAFGVPILEPVFVAVVPDSQSAWAKRAPAISTPYGILVFDTSPDQIAGHIGHEIVHTVTRYRRSHWNTLPIIVEEGLCTLVGYGLNGAKEVALDGEIPAAVVEHYLRLELEDLHLLEGDERTVAYLAATYIAGVLGFDKIQELSIAARKEGHALIPTDWILEAMEEAERVRRGDGSVPVESTTDPLFGRIETDITRETVARITVEFPSDPL